MIVTSIYASILSLLFIFLTIRIIKIRQTNKISIGDGNNLILQKAIRAQSNFCETVPLTLILFFLAENNGAWFVLLNLLGILFAIGRASHAYGISQINENFRFQIFGMVITFTAITGLSLTNLILIFIKL
jgi:uncharacterized membrane protein YecN with MAPEG domain